MNRIRITDRHRAYLAAFDIWLKEVWATGMTGPAAQATTELKDEALAEVVGEPARGGRARRLCVGCRTRTVPEHVPGQMGRPRLYCLTCKPSTIAAG